MENQHGKYEVIYTLILGKQSVKKTEDRKGGVKITSHKKPIGYIVKNLDNGEMIAVSHLEAVDLDADGGITNARTVVSKSQKAGKEVISIYIKAKAGCEPLQSPKYVVDPEKFLPNNKHIKVTKELSRDLASKTLKRNSSGSSEARYTTEQIKKIAEQKRQELYGEQKK